MGLSGLLRKRALNIFCDFLPFPDALDLENACYVIAYANSTSYIRPFNKALYALTHSSKFSQIVIDYNAFKAMSLNDSEIFQVDEELVALIKREQEMEMHKSLIVDLSKNDIDLDDVGITCAKCKSTNISFSFLQIRSGDEGTSVFACCDKCGKRWKLS